MERKGSKTLWKNPHWILFLKIVLIISNLTPSLILLPISVKKENHHVHLQPSICDGILMDPNFFK